LLLTGFAPSVEITHVRQPDADTLVLTGHQPIVQSGDDKIMGPNADALVLSGKVPTVEITHVRTPAQDALILTGHVPVIDITVLRLPDAGSLVLAGKIPSVEIEVTRRPAAGSLALTGYAPSIGADKTTTPDAGSLALTGKIPTVEITVAALPDAGSLVLSGKVPSITLDTFIPVTAGSLALAGKVPALDVQQPVETPGAGSLLLTGHIPTVAITAEALSPDADNLVLTGFAPSVEITVIRQPATGSLVLTGKTTHRPEIQVPTGQITLFTHAPIRPVGLKLTGFAPSLVIVDFGSFIETPDSDSLLITGYAPVIDNTGIEADKTPDTGSIVLDGEFPAIVTDLTAPPSSLLFTGHAPLIGYNIAQTPAGSLVLSGKAPNLITTIEFVPAGSMALTGKAPSVLIEQGGRIIEPPVGSITITGERPFRTTQTEGSASAQILIPSDNAASGTHLLHAEIELPFEMQVVRTGQPLCFLEGSAVIDIRFEADVSGAFGNLKLARATININGIDLGAPSLYWISDGVNLLGRATITI
jgi:phosphohistidine phosphatase SixA